MEPNETPRRRGRSLARPVILICIGLLFLMFNFVPGFDPWPVLGRYWPLILIFAGLGRIYDYYRAKQHPEEPPRAISGGAVAWILLFVLLVAGSWHGRERFDHGRREFKGGSRSTDRVELQGAKSVSAYLEIPAGTLTLSGDSERLLNANFHYGGDEKRPRVDYEVSGDHGQLNITQGDKNQTHFGTNDNDWNLQFGAGAPLDLKVEMGAGESDLKLNGLDVTHLDLEMGAGELNLDLTGARKSSLDGNVQGGAGTATIRLPKDIGVRVKASGGIGSINAQGLTRDGDTYTNAVYGKTPASIDLAVEGGVGSINLNTEP